MEKEKIVDILKSLISNRSVSGEEAGIVSYLESQFKAMGLRSERTEAGSIVGILDSGKPGPTVVMDAHIDTVGIPDYSLWTSDPFLPEVRDGKVYGRGASDMKGALASMIAAVSDMNIKKGRVIIASIVEEERFEGIAAREITELYKPDYVIIGEASEGRLNIGQRGRAEIVVETIGKSCHSSNPEEGVNAALKMMEAVRIIDELPIEIHPILGKGQLVLTDIISSPYPGSSVVPERCRATYDRRTLPGESAQSVIEPIAIALEKAGIVSQVYIAHGNTRTYTGKELDADRFFPSWIMDVDSGIVERAKAGLEKAGLFRSLGHYSFCTNGSHYAGEAGIPTVGFGPGAEKLAHIVDEYVPIDDLELCAKGYRAIAESLLA